MSFKPDIRTAMTAAIHALRKAQCDSHARLLELARDEVAALLKRAEDAEIEVNDCHRVYERDVGQLTLDLQAAEAAREADKVDAIHYARLQDLLNWLIGAPRENQQLKRGEAAESLRVLLSARRAREGDDMSEVIPSSHADCERCRFIDRTKFKKSARCGVRCDCTADCEEYMQFVLDKFLGEKNELVNQSKV